MAQAVGSRGGASVGSSPVQKAAFLGLRTLPTRPVRHGLPTAGPVSAAATAGAVPRCCHCLRAQDHQRKRALPALQARDFDLVLAEEYPGNPSPRPAELQWEDLLDAPLHLALPASVSAPDAAAPTAALRSVADYPWVMEPEGTTVHQARPPTRRAGRFPCRAAW
ncbi:hypothetical protein GCM10010228_66530 [Streptomyces massasporeus]|nr:hypothetical protein GCM10010228_66530 [Streptomyces massasporeus]